MYAARTQEYLELPENRSLPNPALIGFMPPVAATAGTPPTFDNLPDDNRWGLGGSVLECQPTEHPQPLTLTTPWVSGTYHVTVILSQPGIRQGYQNAFTLLFPHDGNHPMHLRGTDARGDELDAGVQVLGRQLALQISDPQGGVALAGLRLERVGDNAPVTPGDDGLKERLRALGYVE